MIISHSKRFIVLATWKAASSTLRARLKAYNESPYSHFYYYNQTLRRVVHGHITCADLIALPEGKLNYRIAAFVRNPYDRVYSGFQQVWRDIHEQPSSEFPSSWVKDLVMRQLAENFGQLSLDFDRWVKTIRKDQIYDVGRNTSFSLHPATYWTHIGETQFVDFIGRVENFDEDFDSMCSMFDISDVPKDLNDNVRRDHAGPESNGYKYTSLMNDESVRKINKLFSEDFETFGYTKIIPSKGVR